MNKKEYNKAIETLVLENFEDTPLEEIVLDLKEAYENKLKEKGYFDTTAKDTVIILSEHQEAEEQPKTPVNVRLKNIKKFIEEWLINNDDDMAGATSAEVDLLAEVLGFRELLEFPELSDEADERNIKAQLQELYALNDSMFKDDINEVPRFTDGTEIKAKDLADMNMNILEGIAELLGFDLDE